jgi:tRNA U38,U39,U40 pseudouridine synthase TruA
MAIFATNYYLAWTLLLLVIFLREGSLQNHHVAAASFCSHNTKNNAAFKNKALPLLLQTNPDTETTTVIDKKESSPSQQPLITLECKFCSNTFASRNALFRHIRSDPTCSKLSGNNADNDQAKTTFRQIVAFQIAYHHCTSNNNQDVYDCEAQVAGLALKKAVENVLSESYGPCAKVISCTQTSVANQRHKVLSQERGVASAGDVVVMSLAVPTSIKEDGLFLKEKLLVKTREYLDATTCSSKNDHQEMTTVRLMACKPLPSDQLFHAERDCTQRIYHYLLPLSWLPDGEKLQAWWLHDDSVKATEDEELSDGNKTTAKVFKSKKPPSDSLRRLRDALRSAESATIPNRRVRRKVLQPGSSSSADDRVLLAPDGSPNIRTGKGRYGAFANKERRPWHNFADPNLRGDASPNQEPVWRVLDGACIRGFISHKEENNNPETTVMAVLEFRGDSFVSGQIRSIVGAALAMTHGWLPSDMFEAATKTHTLFMETPMAPQGRLYSADARFHFHERSSSAGRGLFEHSDVVGGEGQYSTENIMKLLQEQLLTEKAAEKNVREEEEWLKELQCNVAPRICDKISAERKAEADTANDSEEELSQQFDTAPKIYNRTLHLLREILASGSWPETSISRSGVIRTTGEKGNRAGRSGSFTVFNPKIDAIFKDNALPIGNVKFPELTEAIFELEEALSQSDHLDRAKVDGTMMTDEIPSRRIIRPPSLCCAINCNAQFTPHVDSGRGAGQSLSMIVGLGDYVGGELFVEGTLHNIRFKPLEFDGWSSRHWTNHYRGARFSLVWFSPELKGINNKAD